MKKVAEIFGNVKNYVYICIVKLKKCRTNKSSRVMKQIEKIYDLQSKCMTEIYNLLHTKKDKTIDLDMFPFYIVYATGDDTISVRINKVSLNENGDLIMSGSDTFDNEYEFDEGSDIISYATFDMYNAIYQKESYQK